MVHTRLALSLFHSGLNRFRLGRSFELVSQMTWLLSDRESRLQPGRHSLNRFGGRRAERFHAYIASTYTIKKALVLPTLAPRSVPQCSPARKNEELLTSLTRFRFRNRPMFRAARSSRGQSSRGNTRSFASHLFISAPVYYCSHACSFNGHGPSLTTNRFPSATRRLAFIGLICQPLDHPPSALVASCAEWQQSRQFELCTGAPPVVDPLDLVSISSVPGHYS